MSRLEAPPPLPAPDIEALKNWLRSSRPGAVVTYHEGFLAADRSPPWEVQTTRRRPVAKTPKDDLDELAEAAWRYAAFGMIDLVQVMLGPGRWAYVAIRRGKSFALADEVAAMAPRLKATVYA